MKKQSNKTSNMTIKNQTQIEGTMTFIETGNNMHIMDFVNCEDAMMTPFTATCKVQAMRDGNVYITEKPKRVRNTPIFREDNSTFSLGRDERYYFVFSMEKRQVKQLPDALVHQALSIAQKVKRIIER